jgi:DNA-binding CsgD family transcriptional regulator
VVDGLLERDAPLAQLEGLARRVARGGPGEVVLLRGEAGIGKTGVLTKFVNQLSFGLRVLRGWCDPLVSPRPLGPLIDAVAGLDGVARAGLTAAIDAGDTERVYQLLLRALGDAGRRVWVIEDAHWADGATLDLIRFLARRIDTLRLLLVISYRDDDLAPTRPLALTLEGLANYAAVTRIGLEPLSPQAVGVLAAGSGLNAEQLHQLTGGNPFFVTELLAAGPDALTRKRLPHSISEAVCGRLARLSAGARKTAHAAAVCGPRSAVTLLDTMCPDTRTALDECLDSGVLVAEGDLIGFRHELARRATLAQIPDFDRTELHKRALAVLAEPPIDANILATLAFHADQASDREATVRYGIGAAERAASLGANREAASLYGLALRHADATPPAQKVAWLEQHAFTSYLSGQAVPAAASWRDAIALRQALGDRLEEGDDLRWLSQMLHVLEGTEQAVEAGLASLRLLDGLGPTTQLAWSLVNMAEIGTLSYDPRAAGYSDRAVELGSRLGEGGVVIRARSYAALATVFRGNTGWDELEAGWRDAMDSPALAEHVAIIGTIICWTAAMHHDVYRAEGYIAEINAFCAKHDLGTFQAAVVGVEALVGLYRGDWDRAAACVDDVLTRPGLSPAHRTAPLVTRALIRARRGQGAVGAQLDEAAATALPGDLFHLGAVWAARAEAAWLAGDDATACAEAQAGLAAATEYTDPWLVGNLRRWVRLTGGVLETTSRDAANPCEMEISGDWQGAAEAWTHRGCLYDAALAQLGGDIDGVNAALSTFRRLGAKAAARRAQQRLATLRGLAPRTRRAARDSDPHALTGRQREVFDLLAAGLRNPEIAVALHISPKTVGHHVAAIFAKLGVQNRTQAVAYALQDPAASEAELSAADD